LPAGCGRRNTILRVVARLLALLLLASKRE
jgi:hypothetical protein